MEYIVKIILKLSIFITLDIILYQLFTILVNQYYSFKRFFRVILGQFKYKFALVALCQLFSLFFIGKWYFYLYNLIFNLLTIIIIKSLKVKWSKRMIRQYLCGIFFMGFVQYLNWIASFSLLFVTISLIVSYLFLLPCEIIIKNYYIKLAKEKINKINPIIIGITGSYGKTSFRNYLTTALSIKYDVQTPKNNVNTLMGITKFINNELERPQILVLELASDHLGQIIKFKKIFKLDYAIVTSIGNMHLSTFKSVDNIIKEKTSIQFLLKDDGKILINSDDQILQDIKIDNMISFSCKNFKINNFDINGIDIQYQKQNYHFNVHQTFFSTYLNGIIKCGELLQIKPEDILLHSNKFYDYSRRNQVFKTKNGFLIDNSYNANLVGIIDSLKILDSLDGKKYIITGGIIEQGNNFISENKKLQNLFEKRRIIFVGDNNHPLINHHHFEELIVVKNIKEAYNLLKNLSFDHLLLLSKGEDIFLK